MKDQDILHALYEEATIGMLVVNATGVILKVNPFLEKMFAYEHGELEGKAMEILLPDSFRSRHVKHREGYNKKPTPRLMGVNLDLYGLRKNGEQFPVHISLSYVKNKGEQLAIAYIHDASLEKQKAKELENLNTQLEEKVKKRTKTLKENEIKLEKALEKEIELSELKSRFVSMASHEFRTPLSSILSSAGLISRYTELGQQENRLKHIGRIKSSVNNLTSILNDFLSLEKLESGKVTSQISEVNIPEFIVEILNEIKLLNKKNQQIIHQHSGAEISMVDPHLLKNILLNLLSNAIKYSSEGKNVELISERKEATLSITVRDFGIGIPIEDQQHMFTRFFRANNVINIQGTGLGLTIVKRYLDLMNGKIDFESVENEGTTFTVEIPQ